jgi:hypothetical protein
MSSFFFCFQVLGQIIVFGVLVRLIKKTYLVCSGCIIYKHRGHQDGRCNYYYENVHYFELVSQIAMAGCLLL